MNCKHCKFIEKTFGEVLKQEDSSNREYWLMTEVFYYLHGSDICNKNNNELKIALETLINIKEQWVGVHPEYYNEIVDEEINWHKSTIIENEQN